MFGEHPDFVFLFSCFPDSKSLQWRRWGGLDKASRRIATKVSSGGKRSKFVFRGGVVFLVAYFDLGIVSSVLSPQVLIPWAAEKFCFLKRPRNVQRLFFRNRQGEVCMRTTASEACICLRRGRKASCEVAVDSRWPRSSFSFSIEYCYFGIGKAR